MRYIILIMPTECQDGKVAYMQCKYCTLEKEADLGPQNSSEMGPMRDANL